MEAQAIVRPEWRQSPLIAGEWKAVLNGRQYRVKRIHAGVSREVSFSASYYCRSERYWRFCGEFGDVFGAMRHLEKVAGV